MSKRKKKKASREERRWLPAFLPGLVVEKRQFRKFILILFAIYCLSFSSVPFTDTDDQLMLTSAAGFLEMGKFAAPSRFASKDFGGFQFGKASDSGEVYSKYPFGYPMVLVLFLPLAAAASHLFGTVAAEVVLSFPSLLLLIAAALLIWRSALRLELGIWTARLLALAFGLGSFAWGFVGTNYSEPAQACMAAAAFYGLLAARREPDFWKTYSLLGGAALGYGILIRPIFALIAPVLVLGAFWGWFKSHSLKAALIRAGLYAMPGLAASGYLLAANLILFGSAMDFGYGGESFDAPGFEGAVGLLVGLDKGILWYFPLFAAVPLGAWKLWRREQSWAAAVLSTALVLHIAVVSKWWGWSGGWAWGPRLLLPILPFAVLLAGGIITSPSMKRAATVLVLIGIAINSLGITINRRAYGIIRTRAEVPNIAVNSYSGYLPGHLWLFCYALSDLFGGDSFEGPLWKSPPWILAHPECIPAPHRNPEYPIWNPWPIRQFLPVTSWRRGEQGYMRSLLELAIMRYEQGNTERALTLLDRGLGMDERNPEFAAAKGMVYLSSGQPGQALRWFDRSILLDPMYELGYYGRGLMMEAMGNKVAAREAYDRLLRTPQDTLNRKNIEERLEKLKQ
jgi:hypothetical protein